MHPIIYDVAVSLDGYIAGPNGDVTRFAHEGPVVEDYAQRMAGYRLAIMGRATYEFAFQFGLKPGDDPYPAMRTLVFSQSLALPETCDIEVFRKTDRDMLEQLKSDADGPIYLCGGGAFAGALLEMDVIDSLRLKRAPILLGSGVRLFGEGSPGVTLVCRETKDYPDGYVFQEFRVGS
ncbi:dihydrofolate reductase family protein [Denitrobaculum tricleocarpae]|uniref:Dihydrofolate reductase n=1 Tax=Denitrobaculum tricleocarpae TaxID=2591009 RepID=A0A545TP45_9PROT|nr:dihydrofolate reductase family protein [Denitrobaculum tricleocarpae]TQV78992.1 dihydrofolate reductase [Denitrobaculum tricleocarpae]